MRPKMKLSNWLNCTLARMRSWVRVPSSAPAKPVRNGWFFRVLGQKLHFCGCRPAFSAPHISIRPGLSRNLSHEIPLKCLKTLDFAGFPRPQACHRIRHTCRLRRWSWLLAWSWNVHEHSVPSSWQELRVPLVPELPLRPL